MARDALAEFILREARRLIDPSEAELLEVEGGVARVRLRPSVDPRCESCTISAEEFRAFLLGLFARRAPHIKDVEVEVEPEG